MPAPKRSSNTSVMARAAGKARKIILFLAHGGTSLLTLKVKRQAPGNGWDGTSRTILRKVSGSDGTVT